MKKNNNAVLHVWMLPLLFVLSCFAANYLAGSLDYRNIVDERSQRDFNAALGMPLIIGFLWLALRILHRRSGKRIADFLVRINKIHTYKQHMTLLEKKLLRHVTLSAAMAIAITITYLISEDLLAINQQVSVILLNAIAVPFWFFIFLFVIQSASFTRYLYKRLVLPNIEKHFCYCKGICDLGCSNAIFSLFLLLLLPIFWLGKNVPVIDIVIIFSLLIFMIAVLFTPVIKTILVMRRYRQQSLKRIEEKITALMINNDSAKTKTFGSDLYSLNQQLEDRKQYHCWPRDAVTNAKVFAVSTGFPCLCLFITWFLV